MTAMKCKFYDHWMRSLSKL